MVLKTTTKILSYFVFTYPFIGSMNWIHSLLYQVVHIAKMLRLIKAFVSIIYYLDLLLGFLQDSTWHF